MAMITEIEDYFAKGCGRCNRFDTPDCSVKTWQTGLDQLRAICLEVGLEETVKWGQPCYMFAGRNVAIFGAFKSKFTLGFFEAGLMQDPEGVLEKSGPNAQNPSVFVFDENQTVEKLSDVLRAYLREAMDYAQKGLKAPKIERDIEMPIELIDALDCDPELAEAFNALTPGRQKSYAFNLNGAKKSETRIARIAKFRDKILAGKGALER